MNQLRSESVGDRLFVYGTLREGQSARSLLAPSVVRSVAATTSGALWAFPDGYPGVVQGPGVVVGEVVWLADVAATLERLDAYEGDEFARIPCNAVLNSGVHMSAWIYVLSDPGITRRAQRIESGDWAIYSSSSFRSA